MGVSIENIGHAPLFDGLTEAEIEKVLSLAREVRWSEGETILVEGEIGDTIYIVYSGAIKVSKRLTLRQVSDESGDSEKTLLHMEAHDPIIIGEVAMLAKGERTATITATRDCAALEIGGPDLAGLCESDTNLGFKVIRNLARLINTRLRKADQDIVKLSTALSIALSQGR